MVTDISVAVVSRENGRIFANIPAQLVEQLQVLVNAKPAPFGFAHHSTRLGVDYVSVFEVKAKYLPYVEPALSPASRTEKLHRRSSIKAPGLSLTARVVGCHAAYLLGSVPVKEKSGNKTVQQAIAQLQRRTKKTNERALFVTLVCSKESITYVEALTDDILHETHMGNVSFITLFDVSRFWRAGVQP